MRRSLYVIALAIGIVPLAAGRAQACMVDNKPSAFADGTRAVLSPPPTRATYAGWAHFTFPRVFRPGEHIRFYENDAEVRRVLTLADPRRPWRWRFGDSDALIGDRATHIYRHPGRYTVSVDAYFPRAGWLTFDMITVTVRAGTALRRGQARRSRR